jgi:DNA-binding MarR family transcriptional regulator
MSTRRASKSGETRRQSLAKPAQGPAEPRLPVVSEQVKVILDRSRPENVVSDLLRRAHFSAEDLFAREFAGEQITARQKAALVVLHQHPGLSQHALADRLHLDPNTVAEMVRRLVASGWIRRAPAQSDRRAYELFLTASSIRLLDRIMPRDSAVERRLIERLPKEYRPLFVKCLRLIVDPVRKADE